MWDLKLDCECSWVSVQVTAVHRQLKLLVGHRQAASFHLTEVCTITTVSIRAVGHLRARSMAGHPVELPLWLLRCAAHSMHMAVPLASPALDRLQHPVLPSAPSVRLGTGRGGQVARRQQRGRAAVQNGVLQPRVRGVHRCCDGRWLGWCWGPGGCWQVQALHPGLVPQHNRAPARLWLHLHTYVAFMPVFICALLRATWLVAGSGLQAGTGAAPRTRAAAQWSASVASAPPTHAC